MCRWKWLVAFAVIVALVGTAWYGLRQIPVSRGYTVRVECERLPGSDAALEEWLGAHRGVATVGPVVRDSNTISVTWIMSQRAGGNDPPAPDLFSAFESLGYVRPVRLPDDRPR